MQAYDDDWVTFCVSELKQCLEYKQDKKVLTFSSFTSNLSHFDDL